MRETIITKLGQTYNISLDKLLSNKSYIYKRPNTVIVEEDENEIEQEKPLEISGEGQDTSKNMKKEKEKDVGYFCSELVAKMYKDVKILTSDEKNINYKPSCNFYPYHFTEKFNLHLIEG